MTILHTVNKSPFEDSSLESCLRCSKAGSTILLIEDGIYGATEGTIISDKVKAAMADRTVCALQPDVEARGMKDKIIEGIKLVDYAGFVDLATENDTVESWL